MRLGDIAPLLDDYRYLVALNASSAAVAAP